MTEICPITDERINERIARANAFITLSLVVAFILTDIKLLLIILIADFLLRGFLKGKYSPVKKASGWIIRLINPTPKYINAGPKQFAAKIGFVLSVAVLTLFILQLFTISFIVAGILIFFSFLESVFGICVACIIYPFLYRSG